MGASDHRLGLLPRSGRSGYTAIGHQTRVSGDRAGRGSRTRRCCLTSAIRPCTFGCAGPADRRLASRICCDVHRGAERFRSCACPLDVDATVHIPRSGHAPSCGGVRSRYRIRVGVGQVAPTRATPAVSGRHRHCTHGVRFVSRIRKFPRGTAFDACSIRSQHSSQCGRSASRAGRGRWLTRR